MTGKRVGKGKSHMFGSVGANPRQSMIRQMSEMRDLSIIWSLKLQKRPRLQQNTHASQIMRESVGFSESGGICNYKEKQERAFSSQEHTKARQTTTQRQSDQRQETLMQLQQLRRSKEGDGVQFRKQSHDGGKAQIAGRRPEASQAPAEQSR
jgi:hypothetical protein